MFNLGITQNVRGQPKIRRADVPPPTPVRLPPVIAIPPSTKETRENLVADLQAIYRVPDLNSQVLGDIGLQLKYDVTAEELIPDPSHLPPFDEWDKLNYEQARAHSQTHGRKLPSGHNMPGALQYKDMLKEMSWTNNQAFRVIRRLPAIPGTETTRLGNSYDFYKHLEALSFFWDDTTAPPKTEEEIAQELADDEERMKEQAAAKGKTGEPNIQVANKETDYFRSESGAAMPNELRHNITNAFAKLIVYSFGGNTTAPRAEPRLQMSSLPDPVTGRVRHSYIASAATFIFRSPADRESARAMFVEGPIAGVSSRGTLDFDNEVEVSQDISRELIAALICAQHRDREGKEEKRFGQNAWWTTKPRWGGGKGGAIGREEDPNADPGDKDSAPQKKPKPTYSQDEPSSGSPFGKGRLPYMGMQAKRVKKSTNPYDGYREVRPPASTWDRKARYKAIGRAPGAGYDDIFLISSVYHHISIVRVRVPLGLLKLLDGDKSGADYSGLIMYRSKWFDLFKSEDRMEGLRILWGMMEYQLRDTTQDAQKSGDS